MDNYKIFKAKIRALKVAFIGELLYRKDPVWNTGYPIEYMRVPDYAIEELEEEELVIDFFPEWSDEGKIKKYNLQTAKVTEKGKAFYEKYKEKK